MFAGSLAALLLLEVLLRLMGLTYPRFYRPDEFCGVSLMPEAAGWYRREGKTYIRINSDGFRDREHSKIKPNNTLRVAVLGDSYAEAFQVPLEDTFWKVAEREIAANEPELGPKVEVLNFGVSGYGTTQELMTLRHRVWPYSPDIVILAFVTGNDITDNSPRLRHSTTVPYLNLRGNELVLDATYMDWYHSRQNWWFQAYQGLLNNSCVLQAIRNVQYRRNVERTRQQQLGTEPSDCLTELGLSNDIYAAPSDPLWSDAWAVTEAVLTLMSEEVKAGGSQFLVATLSNALQVDPRPAVRQFAMKQLGVTNLLYPDLRIKSLGDRVGFTVLNLAPELQAYAESNQTFLHGTGPGAGKGHWNAQGHRVAGHLIAKRLLADFLPR